ncbi:expressed unknown protein [Seminavis robusta]|uniref:Uncharacterized protein n=1 Tax=Seminavis robusta TaxID=568900 RepID=A0A9N8HZ08_9STRA|nr:expressed unknown protein [Seminavis robusta]|eukprot:Sro3119_g344160.1 n/a (277) ;mRNA; r:6547-7377
MWTRNVLNVLLVLALASSLVMGDPQALRHLANNNSPAQTVLLTATPAATPAATASATPGATPGATTSSTADGTMGAPAPTTSPGDVTASPTVQVGVAGITVIEPSPTSDPTCAATLLNTDEACSQLLKVTMAVCDCYNFCAGRLIGCLEFGEQSSFSCAGETVAGCTIDQKVYDDGDQKEDDDGGNIVVLIVAIVHGVIGIVFLVAGFYLFHRFRSANKAERPKAQTSVGSEEPTHTHDVLGDEEKSRSKEDILESGKPMQVCQKELPVQEAALFC